MQVNKIKSVKTVHFAKEWEGELVEWDANETALTPQVIQYFADVNKNPMGMAVGLAGILTNWNVFVEKEDDFPPTVENLGSLPLKFLTFLLESMSETWQGGKQASASQST